MSQDVDSEHKTRRVRRLIIRIIVPLVITVFLISILLYFSNPKTILQLIQNSNPSSLITSFGVYACVYLIRTLRFQQFPQLNQLSTSDLLPIASLHSFINLIFPMRSGELSLVYLLRKYHKTEIGSGIGILLLVRLFDLIALALCLAGSLVLFGLGGANARDPLLLVISILLGLLITLISLTASISILLVPSSSSGYIEVLLSRSCYRIYWSCDHERYSHQCHWISGDDATRLDHGFFSPRDVC